MCVHIRVNLTCQNGGQKYTYLAYIYSLQTFTNKWLISFVTLALRCCIASGTIVRESCAPNTMLVTLLKDLLMELEHWKPLV